MRKIKLPFVLRSTMERRIAKMSNEALADSSRIRRLEDALATERADYRQELREWGDKVSELRADLDSAVSQLELANGRAHDAERKLSKADKAFKAVRGQLIVARGLLRSAIFRNPRGQFSTAYKPDGYASVFENDAS